MIFKSICDSTISYTSLYLPYGGIWAPIILYIRRVVFVWSKFKCKLCDLYSHFVKYPVVMLCNRYLHIHFQMYKTLTFNTPFKILCLFAFANILISFFFYSDVIVADDNSYTDTALSLMGYYTGYTRLPEPIDATYGNHISHIASGYLSHNLKFCEYFDFETCFLLLAIQLHLILLFIF